MAKWVLLLAMVHRSPRSLEQPGRQLGICVVCLGTTKKPPHSGPSLLGKLKAHHIFPQGPH